MSSDLAGERPHAAQASRRQCAEAVLMVRPACFGFNPETAVTNKLQRPPADAARAADASAAARAELDAVAAALEGEGVKVCRAEDTPQPAKPDAAFANNWVSFHEDGTVVLYPLQAPSRRPERRWEIIERAAESLGYRISQRVDLTAHEIQSRYLEGTGSLVLDHPTRTAYACLSARTDAAVVASWASALGYEAVTFHAADRKGAPLYHTNVLMSIGERFVVIGTEAIAAADREPVLERLRSTGREVLEIDQRQIGCFAGNVLELASWDEALGDCGVLVMSHAARAAFDPEAFARLSACTDEVLVTPIPVIERLGGGSVRCLLTEVFLPA